uniref:Uncharacterized protein n=1 Tax=Leersia perrieri TaxID=77586 RepID=A0A0D9VFR5_9ORYZ
MPQQPQPATGSRLLDAVPLFVVVLLAAHVLALVSLGETAAAEEDAVAPTTPPHDLVLALVVGEIKS